MVSNPKIRRDIDGTLFLTREDHDLEKELDREYIRVKGELRWHVTPKGDNIKMLSNYYLGQTGYIVGKGPSLEFLDTIGDGPVICINESVHFIEKLGPREKLYNLQLDGALGERCRPTFSKLILNSTTMGFYHDMEKYYINLHEFDLPPNTLSVCAAIKILQAMGVSEIKLLSFDGLYAKRPGYPAGIFDLRKDPDRFAVQSAIVLPYLKDIKHEFIIPVGRTRTAPVELTLITCTGDRPEAFALCEAYMKRQTYKQKYTWIVVDDGVVPTKCTMKQTYIRREPQKSDPPHTLVTNLLEALPLVKTPKLLFIEDDDWYAPEYLLTYSNWLNFNNLVGMANTRYYNLPQRKYMIWDNTTHSALCQTGITDSLYPYLLARCKADNDPKVDLHLYQKISGQVHKLDRPLCIGLKGFPGRKGQLSGHNPDARYSDDSDYKVLTNWIGDDIKKVLASFDGDTLQPVPQHRT